MFKQENPNFVASKYAPNPQEVSYWIDLMADSSGNVIKSYTGEKWIPLNRDANVDQWTHIREIVESVGLTFDRDSDIISLPSFDSNNYFKGSSVIEAINNGDTALKTEVDRLDDKIDAVDDDLQEFKSTKGQPGGLAELDDTGKVPASQLPSYVDDVVDVYATFDMSEVGMLDSIQLYKDPEHTIPVIGERDKIYINCTEGEPGYQFRWSGTQWVHIDSNALIIGEVTGTAFDGARGKHLEDIENSMPEQIVVGHQYDVAEQLPLGMQLNYRVINKQKDGTYGKPYKSAVEIPRVTELRNGIMLSSDYKTLNKIDRKVRFMPNQLTVNLDVQQDDANQLNIPVIYSKFDVEDGVYKTQDVKNLTIVPATTTVAGLMTGDDKVMITSTLPDAITDERIAREAAVTALEAKDIELKQDITDLDTTVNADITTLRSTILKVNDATGLTEDNTMPDMSSTNYLNGSPSMVSSTVTLDHHLGVLQKSVQWTRLESARYVVNFNELFADTPQGRYATKLITSESPLNGWYNDSYAVNEDWVIPSYKINVTGIDTDGSGEVSPSAYIDVYAQSGSKQEHITSIALNGENVVPECIIPYVPGESRKYSLLVEQDVDTQTSDIIIEQVKL